MSRILVVGSGAIGSFYGGKLVQAGADVAFLCRSDYDIVKDRGIMVESTLGDFHFRPCKVVKSCEELDWNPDYILVCLKVLPEINVPEIIAPSVSSNTAICLIQNGIYIELPVVDRFPENEIISGLAFICCQRVHGGFVRHLDYGRLVLGNYPAGVSDKTRRLVELFNKSGVACEATEDVIKARWQKLIWNAPFNPISVLAGGLNTQEMLSNPAMEGVIRSVMAEVCELARADGHPLPDSVVDENISFTRVMTPYKTSMLLDYESKKPMEVEAILGNALRKAIELDIPVPHIETLYVLLSALDKKNRNQKGDLKNGG